MAKEYKIKIQGNLIEVSEEIYLTYYRMADRARALRRKDRAHGTVSYSALDTEETLGEEMICDSTAESLENIAITNILSDKLHQCLNMLPQEERDLLYALYFDNLSERDLSQKTGVLQQTINYRKRRALKHLKKMMNN